MDWTEELKTWAETTFVDLTTLSESERADVEAALTAIADAGLNYAAGVWDADRARAHAANAKAVLTDIGLAKGWGAKAATQDFLSVAIRGLVRTAIGAVLA